MTECGRRFDVESGSRHQCASQTCPKASRPTSEPLEVYGQLGDPIERCCYPTLLVHRRKRDLEVLEPLDGKSAVPHGRARRSSANEIHAGLTQEKPPRPVRIDTFVDCGVGQEAMRADPAEIRLRRVSDRSLPCLDVAKHEVPRQDADSSGSRRVLSLASAHGGESPYRMSRRLLVDTPRWDRSAPHAAEAGARLLLGLEKPSFDPADFDSEAFQQCQDFMLCLHKLGE